MHLSIDNNKVYLNYTDDKFVKLNSYSETSKKIWECIRYLLSILSCGCCKFDPFLQISFQGKKIIYILPADIKKGLTSLGASLLPSQKIEQEQVDNLLKESSNNAQKPPLSPDSEDRAPTNQEALTKKNHPKKVEESSPLLPVKTGPLTTPTVRVRIINESKPIASTDSLLQGLFAQRPGTHINYICTEEAYDAAIVIKPYTQRPQVSQLVSPSVKDSLKATPVVLVFVESSQDSSSAAKPPSQLILETNDISERCTLLQLLCNKEGIINVDPHQDTHLQSKWNITQINKLHTFMQEQVLKKPS